MPQFDAFLSHSSEDKPAVRNLASRLRNHGLTVWLDEEQIQPGHQITECIESGLKTSNFVLVCLSPRLAESNWVRAEYGPLLHKEVSHRNVRVIPVLLEPVSDDQIPVLLYDKARIDTRDEYDFRRLVKILHETRGVMGPTAEALSESLATMPTRVRTIFKYHDYLLNAWRSMGAHPNQTWIISGWGSAETQVLRFKALIHSIGYKTGSLLDIGCGVGDLATFLKERGLLDAYEGWDFNPRLVQIAKEMHPDLTFRVLDHTSLPNAEFDWIVASGIFQYKDTDNPAYYLDVCRDMYARCRNGVSVNFLSTLRDPSQKSDDELYLDPGHIMHSASSITGYWTVDHSYHPGSADFTLALMRPTPLKNPWRRPHSTLL